MLNPRGALLESIRYLLFQFPPDSTTDMSFEFFTPDNDTTKMALHKLYFWIGNDLSTSITPAVRYDGKTTADKNKVS